MNATIETCPCGKRPHASRADAERIVLEAKIRSGVRGRTHRREARIYQCRTNPRAWHTTSQPSPLPSYGPEDDEIAERYISRAVHGNDDDPEPWRWLLAEDRVEQTRRVLGRIHQSVLAQESQHRQNIESLKAQARARELDRQAVWDAERERAEWAKRTAYFKASVVSRLQEARGQVKELRIRRAASVEREQRQQDRSAVEGLAKAVAAHRAATAEPTAADRQLWAWLGLLSVHYGKGVASVVSLATLLETEWAVDTEPDAS